jgi:hypothetical protein
LKKRDRKAAAIYHDFREKKARDGLWNSLKASLTVEECERLLGRSILPPGRIYAQAIEMWIESR